MIKPEFLFFLVIVTYVSTAALDKDVEKTIISDESKMEPNIELAISEDEDFESKLKPVQEIGSLKPVQKSALVKPVQEIGSLKPVQESVIVKPVQEIGSLKPVQESAFLKPVQEIEFLKPVQESGILKANQESSFNAAENEIKPIEGGSDNPIPEEVNSETPLKILFGGNKCKEVISKTTDGKVFISWLEKDCPKPIPQPQKPLFNSGFGLLPIPTTPPRIPDDFPKYLLPLLPVQ